MTSSADHLIGSHRNLHPNHIDHYCNGIWLRDRRNKHRLSHLDVHFTCNRPYLRHLLTANENESQPSHDCIFPTYDYYAPHSYPSVYQSPVPRDIPITATPTWNLRRTRMVADAQDALSRCDPQYKTCTKTSYFGSIALSVRALNRSSRLISALFVGPMWLRENLWFYGPRHYIAALPAMFLESQKNA